MKTTKLQSAGPNRTANLFRILAVLCLLLLAGGTGAWAQSAGTTIDMAVTNPASSGTGWTYANSIYTIRDGANVTVTGSNSSSYRRIAVAGNAAATVTLDGVSIVNYYCAFSVSNAKVYLILAGTNVLQSDYTYAGLYVANNGELTIDGTGSLSVTGGTGAAGIGSHGGEADCKNRKITINGGTIIATAGGISGDYNYGSGGGAGIGNGSMGENGNSDPSKNSGTITINGGTVTATGAGAGAGIGGGGQKNQSCGPIIINGGMIIANATNGAAIGGGNHNSNPTLAGTIETITINGGTIIATLTGSNATINPPAIGSRNITTGHIYLNGGSIKMSNFINIAALATNQDDKKVYLNTLTAGETPLLNTAITAGDIGSVACDPSSPPAAGRYGIKDVVTDTEGKVYFWLPETSGEEAVALKTTGRLYSHSYTRAADNNNAATLGMKCDLALDKTGVHVFPIETQGYSSAPAALTVTVSNAGSEATNALKVELSGTAAESFTLSEMSLEAIGGGDSKTFTVAPKAGLAPGAHAATVTVSDEIYGISASFEVRFIVNSGDTQVDISTGLSVPNGESSGRNWYFDSPVLHIENGANITVTGIAHNSNRAVVAAGAAATVTLQGASIDVRDMAGVCAFDMAGATVSLTLAGENVLISGAESAGLRVPSGAMLVIDGTGILEATGGYTGAGIGGSYNESGGNITILSGEVTATGGEHATGIGGGRFIDSGGNSGTITISGGVVWAIGGTGTAAIGYAGGGGDGEITITGGVIKTTCDSDPNNISAGLHGRLTFTGGSIHAAKVGSRPTNSSGAPVYLNTLTVGSTPVANTAISAGLINGVECDPSSPPENGKYGIKDVVTDLDGKVYFWLPATGSEEAVELTTTGGVYSGSYTRNSSDDNAATLALRYGIVLNPGVMYDFPDVTIGYTAAAAAALTVTVSNAGSEGTGELGLALTGTDAGSFTLSGASIADLTAGSSDTFTLTPKTGLAIGDYAATVTVSNAEHGISASLVVYFTVTEGGTATTIDIGTGKGDDGHTAGPGWHFSDPVLHIQNGANVTVTGSASNGQRIEVAAHAAATVTLRDVTIEGLDAISTEGLEDHQKGELLSKQAAILLNDGAGVTLNLEGSSSLTGGEGMAGIRVVSGTTLVINGPGALLASTSVRGTATGIGADTYFRVAGDLTINSGTITAIGNGWTSGIGGSDGGKNGTVTINGGMVTAISGIDYNIAGINGSNSTQGSGLAIIKGGSVKTTREGIDSEVTNGAEKVFLNTLTVGSGENINTPVIACSISNEACDLNSPPADGAYSIKDVATDEEGKVYFWLPETDKCGIITLTTGAGVFVGLSGEEATLNRTSEYAIELCHLSEVNFGVLSEGYAVPAPISVAITNTGQNSTGALTVTLTDGETEAFKLSTDLVASIEQAGATGNFTVVPAQGIPAGDHWARVTITGEHDIQASFSVHFFVDYGDTEININEGRSVPHGDVTGLNWHFDNRVLYIRDGASVTVTGAGHPTSHRIDVAAGAAATVTLKDVTIEGLYGDESAFLLNAGANVTLHLEGTNSLRAGDRRAGIQTSGATLTLDGTGALTAGGGYHAAGIGGGVDGSGGNITITGGTIKAIAGESEGGAPDDIGKGGYYHADAGVLTITGGSINAASATPTNGSVPVYLNTLTVGNPTVVANMPITAGSIGSTSCSTVSPPAGGYGIQGVATDGDGNVYFWLPKAVQEEEVKLTVAADQFFYSATYTRIEDNTNAATLTTPYGVRLDPSGAYEFPEATYGYTDQPTLTVTVTNAGHEATGALTVTLTGADAGSFTLPETSIASIAAGNSDTFTVAPNTGLAAGTYAATVTVSDEANDIRASFGVGFVVHKKDISITGGTITPKIYDGTTAATVTELAFEGLENDETLALTTDYTVTSASFTDAGAGAGNYKWVEITVALVSNTTTDNYNPVNGSLYNLAGQSIAPATLTVNNIGVNNKVYDGTTAATFSGTPTLAGVISGDEDEVWLTGGTPAFADPNVAEGISITFGSVQLVGAKAGNYVLAPPPGITANITAATVSVVWGNTAFTYTGSEQVPTATAIGVGDEGDIPLTVTGGQTDAGTGSASASMTTPTVNYTLSNNTTSFEIAAATVSVAWGNTAFTYTGSEQAPTATATGIGSDGDIPLTVTGGETNAGTGSASASMTSVNANYTLSNSTTPFEIAAATVSVAWGNTAFTYTGSEQAPAATATGVGDEGDIPLTVTGGQTDAGTGSASASMTSVNANYTLANTTATFEIAAAMVSVAWGNTAFTYTGSEQAPTATATGVGSDGDIPLTVTGGRTDAGTGYEASASMTSVNANYTLANTTATFEIAAATVSVAWGNTAFTYTGSEQAPTATATGVGNDGDIPLTVTGGRTDAGTGYQASASMTSVNANYTLSNSTTPFEIAAATVSVAWGNTAFTYTGSEQAPAATATGVGSDGDISLTVTGGQTDAGTGYQASASMTSVNANYTLSNSTTPFEIAAATVSVAWGNTAFTYTGSEQAPTATATGIGDEGDIPLTVTGGQTDAGTGYQASASMTSVNDNYTLSNSTTPFEIAAATVSVAWGNTAFTYTGSEQVPTATATGIGNDGDISLTVTGGQTDAGTGYQASASMTSVNANYTLANSTTPFEIAAATVSVAWGNTAFTYTGSEQVPTATATGIGNDGDIPLTVTGGRTDAGTGYQASASMTSVNANYTLSNSTTPFEIAAATVSVAWGNTAFTYTGSEQVPSATATGVGSDGTIPLTVTGGQTDAGTGYQASASMTTPTANYTLSNSTTPFEIAAATVSVAWGNTAFTYTGSEQVPTATATGVGSDGDIPLTITGGRTDAGTGYQASASMTSVNANYTLSNSTTPFEIAAATVSVAWGNTAFTYTGSEQAPTATATGVGNDGDISLTVTGGRIDAGTGYQASASMTAANPNYTLTNTSTLFEITPAPQVITFEPVETWGVSDGNYSLTATVSSGLPVKFRTDNAALAEISDNILVPKQAGTITVTAYVDATDNNYQPAEEVSRVITLTNNSTAVTEVTVSGAEQQDDGVWVVDCDLAGTTVTITITTDDPSATVEYHDVLGKTFTVDARDAGIHTEPYTVIAPDGTPRDTSFRLEKRLAYEQVVIQRWNNTLLINNNPATNGGYTFAAYQWYRNGEAIAGATAQYYSAGNKATDVLGDALYHTALTTATGEPLRTCPAPPEAMAMENLTAYPNPLRSGDVLRLDMGMDAASLEGAEVFVYSMAGELLLRQKAAGNPVELRLNLPMGIYIVRINNRQVKILIN